MIRFTKNKLNFSELSGDLIFYSLLGVVEKITPFLILNIAIFFFKDEEIGRYSLLLIIFTLLLPLLSFEVNRYVESIYFREKIEKYIQKRNELLGTILLLVFVLSPVLYFLFNGYFDITLLFFIMIFSVFPYKIKEIYTSELRCSREKKKITEISILTSILRFTCFVLISLFEETRTGFFLILTFLVPINIVGFYIFFDKNNLFRVLIPSLINFKCVMMFCLPFVPYAFSGILQNQLDKLFLTNQTTLSLLGIYSILFSFGMPLKFLSNSFAQAWTPHFLNNSNEFNFELLKKKYFLFFLLAIIIYYLIAILILKNFYPLKVSQHNFILIPLFFGFYFRSIKQIEIPNFVKSLKTSKLIYEFIITLISSIIFSYLFLIKFEMGIVGASIVFSINQFVSLVTLLIIRKWHLF